MKVSREQAARNRERIVEVAAKLFREHGFDGVGVADLMHAAGLTHGGFYGHFESKEELMAEACARARSEAISRWQGLAQRVAQKPLAALTRLYLSRAHRDHPGRGCMLAALGPEVARQPLPIRHVFTEAVSAMVELLGRLMPGRSKAAARKKALTACATLVGAIVLARAVSDAALSEEILQAASTSLSPHEDFLKDSAN